MIDKYMIDKNDVGIPRKSRKKEENNEKYIRYYKVYVCIVDNTKCIQKVLWSDDTFLCQVNITTFHNLNSPS